jgi:MOSC domain-containing protein YiiM
MALDLRMLTWIWCWEGFSFQYPCSSGFWIGHGKSGTGSDGVGKESWMNKTGDPLMTGSVVAVCTSLNKGERKKPVSQVTVIIDRGIEGDAHAGDWHRQVSLLAMESIEKMQKLGLSVKTGDFAENITTKGIDLPSLPIGTRMKVGETLLEVTQIGKECHTRCAIYHQAGDCVMPKEGIFARVLQGGRIRPGDLMEVMGDASL